MVGAGAPLGRVGATGNARGGPPHLHYGIYTAGGAMNPFPRLMRQEPLSAARAADASGRRRSIGAR